MRFNLACAVLAFGFAAFAAEPNEVFAAHCEDITSGRVTAVGGCLFGVGSATPAGKSVLSHDTARRKAELLAQSDLLVNEVLKNVQWPADWSAEQIASARAFAKTHGNYSANATARGMVTLSSKIVGGEHVVVVGVPETGVSVSAYVDFMSVKKAMDDFEEAERQRAEAERQRLEAERQLTETDTAAISNAETADTNVTLSVGANMPEEKAESESSSRELPIDLGDGKKILMDNSDKDDLFFENLMKGKQDDLYW